MKNFIVGLLAAAVVFASGCESVSTTSAGAVGVDRKQQMLVSNEAIEQGAAQAYDAELKAGARQGRAQHATRRSSTASRRSPNASSRSHRSFARTPPRWNWQFNVQKTKELNAYCMPGGRIMVYSGLIDSLDLSDAELATVIGHEIAHALREHTRERVSRAYAQQLVLSGAAAVAGAERRHRGSRQHGGPRSRSSCHSAATRSPRPTP